MRFTLKTKMLLLALSVLATLFGWTRIAITHARTDPRRIQAVSLGAITAAPAPEPMAMTGSSR